MRIVMIAFSNIEYTVELSEALSKFEEVILMIPGGDAERFAKVLDPSLILQPFYMPRMRYPSNIVMIWNIIKKINRFKPDIIHLQKGHPWFNFALYFLKRYCLVTTIHDVVLLDWPSLRIPAFTYTPPIRTSTLLIVHGQSLKASMVREYHRLADDIHVFPRGVNSIYTRFNTQSVDEERHTIMYFGRIWEYKGIEYLIKAEPLISERVPDVKIVIAGTGEDFQKYRDMMVHPERFVVHNEYIPDKDVARLFKQCSVVVLPYIDGSQSGVIPQAYAFKKPVVVTDVGSLPENVDHNVTGYVVPPRDSVRLAEAISDLLMDDDKRRQMGENAYDKTKKELSWMNIAPLTVEAYKEALCKKKYEQNVGIQRV